MNIKTIAAAALCVCATASGAVTVPTTEAMPVVNGAEYAVAVRPGNPETGAPFWNTYAHQFMYAPSFEFKRVAGAARYRYTVTDDHHRIFRFEGSTPWCTLAPVWKDLVTGQTSVVVEGLDVEGRALGLAGERAFWKAAPFAGAYPPPARSYADAAVRCCRYMAGTRAVSAVLDEGEPAQDYGLNCYPSKMHAANILSMLDYAALDPDVRTRAIALARAEADYLISIMEPADAALPYFTPTYKLLRTPAAKGTVADIYIGQSMNIYPAESAGAFLALYDAVKDAKYLEAAEKIASTYLKEQRPDGTWYVKQYLKDGQPVAENIMIPTVVMRLLDRLAVLTGKRSYADASARAFAWIEEHPLKTWYWEGHFEDTLLLPIYRNLTKHTAIDVMLYLLEKFPNDPKRLAQAREIMRFSEDQFVFWENWLRPGLEGHNPAFVHLPGVAEQYECYYVFDASASKLVLGYLALYRAEGNVLDLMKAKALADTITRVQRDSGRIPTGWAGDLGDEGSDWINCMGFSVRALRAISAYQDACNRLATVKVPAPIAPSVIRVKDEGKNVPYAWKDGQLTFSVPEEIGDKYTADVEFVFTAPSAGTYRVTFDADWRLWVTFRGREIFALPEGFRSPKCDHEMYLDLVEGENVFTCRFGAGSKGAVITCRLRPVFVETAL